MNISSTMIVRIAVAALFVFHGVMRIVHGQVGTLGPFLESNGFPFGIAWAWAVTIIEIGGGVMLALGRYTAPLAAYFIVEVGIGIWLVHWKTGWFAGGPGRNGMEFSVLLLACLISILLGKK